MPVEKMWPWDWHPTFKFLLLEVYTYESVRQPHRGWRRGRWRLVQSKLLPANRRIRMNVVNLSVGHKVALVLVYLDQNGNPMLTPPTPDAAPTWSDDTPATGTLTPAPDGSSAEEVAIAAGNDTISVAVTIGGTAYSASLGLVVSPAAQVFTSVAIEGTVS